VKSIDCFFDRKFQRPEYTCMHFADEVWQHVTGEGLSDRLGALLGPPEARRFTKAQRTAFTRLERPVSPCVAIMQSGAPGASPHVGIYLEGRILHITKEGVEFLFPEFAARGFKTVRYYK
jgi:hypothetical protein